MAGEESAMAKKKKAKAKKSMPKKRAAKKKAAPKKKGAMRKGASKPIRARGKSESINTVTYEPKGRGARSGGQSGDLQGISDRERADSESVGELLEEGNAFEAELVDAVENAPEERELRTHEVPEDDVPEEYLERDEK
jgi:hypothetical protein